MRNKIWCVVLLFCLGTLPLAAGEPAVGDLEALKAQLAVQQQQIRQLQEMIRQQGALLEALQRRLAGAGTAEVVPASLTAAAAEAPLEQRVQKLEETVAEARKENDKTAKRLANFSFSGDLRIRYEPFFQDGTEQRHRERGRLRFGATTALTKELSGGLRIATGGLDNPQATNQSFTGFFTRKSFDLDQFWLTYKPERARWFSLTAGKFAYSWYRTELTFDNDLNPEGFTQVFSFDYKDSPLTNLTFVAFELPFNEVGSAGDSFILGGQVQSRWKLGERVQLGLHAAGLNFRNADSIAQAFGAGTLRPSLPLANRLRTNGSGSIIGFGSRYAYLDLIAELNYRWRPRWPVRLTLDVVNNVRTTGERSGYWAELALGQTAEKGDWQFGYTLMRIERDAVIGAFNFDDLRASSNVLNHRLKLDYLPHKNVTFEWTLLVGRLFNPHENVSLVPAAFRPLGQDPFLTRMQFDVIYKF